MIKHKKCKYCGSEFVCWNWMYCRTFKTWWGNFIKGFPCAWKRPWIFVTQRWAGECWECQRIIHTIFKVRNGISYDTLKETFVYLPKHELRDSIEEINYLFYDGYKVWIKERCDERLDIALKGIRNLLEKKFNEEGVLPPNDIVSILKKQDNVVGA